jgi:hypothetical protein
MVLLGEQDELNYRLMKRRFVDLLSLAPVAGLQSYLRDRSIIVEASGPTYISPQGGNAPPLRNMRTARVISAKHLLDDGVVRIYRVLPQSPMGKVGFSQRVTSAPLCLALAISTWTILAGLLAVAFLVRGVTWVGKSNLLAFAGWSVILRLADALSFVPGHHRTTNPRLPHSAIFMGRRHSAFILEGTRADIVAWTSHGLRFRDNIFVTWLGRFTRFGTLLLLLYIFVTIPNGSPDDQVLFVALNILGQASTWIGQRLHVQKSFQGLELIENIQVATRTHVYAILLRKYEDKDWVDNVGLMPKTPKWANWRREITVNLAVDAKVLYEQCDDAVATPP